MKIDSNKPAGTPSTPSGAARARSSTPGAASAQAQSAGQSTETTLSGAHNVDSVLASTPIVDADRVAEIKRAIAEGRFQVNPERIADSLLQSVRDMLATDRQQ